MSRIAICCVVLFLALVTPVAVPAQGLLGNILYSLGGIGGSANPYSECAGQGPLSLNGDAAVTYETIDLSFDARGAGLDGIANIRHYYTFGGVTFGVSASAMSPQGFGVMARFTVLAASTSRDHERYNVGGVGPPRRRFWKTDNDTYSLEGAGFISVYDSASLLGGFRWDHLETTFDRPDSPVNIASLPSDEAVLKVNAYQPYVGVIVDQGGSHRRLRAGVLGWPQVYGSLTYGETDGGAFVTGARIDNRSISLSEGYFWEIFGDYGVRETSFVGATFSVFAKWTQYHYRGVLDSDANIIGAGTLASDDFEISIHRNAWSVGLRVHVPVTLPFGSFIQ